METIITPKNPGRWSHVHEQLHDLIQIYLQEYYGRKDAASWSLTKWQYVGAEKLDDEYSMHLELQLKAPEPNTAAVLLGLTLAVREIVIIQGSTKCSTGPVSRLQE